MVTLRKRPAPADSSSAAPARATGAKQNKSLPKKTAAAASSSKQAAEDAGDEKTAKKPVARPGKRQKVEASSAPAVEEAEGEKEAKEQTAAETATAAQDAEVNGGQGKAGAEAEGGAEEGRKPKGAPKVGDTITLEGFGGEVETNDGKRVTLKELVDESKAGVVVFTYPKASTPGCTTQACSFRDSHDALTSGPGLTIFGLSADSPKANTTFKTKHALPYTLLCDPQGSLLRALGLHKPPKGAKRGVVVMDKKGKVLVAMQGGPAATVEAVKEVVEGMAKGE